MKEQIRDCVILDVILGVIVDEKLTFRDHVNSIQKDI